MDNNSSSSNSGSSAQTSASQAAGLMGNNAPGGIKIEDGSGVGGNPVFTGQVLTTAGGVLKIPDEARGYCVLFDHGLWMVSAAHRRSPLVASVAQVAKRQGYKVNEPRYVTPNLIEQAYLYADRTQVNGQLDDNATRRKIVQTLERAMEVGANDIHIEASGNRTKIEFRIDGALRVWETWTQREGEQMLSSIYAHSIGQSGATANWLEPQAAMLTGTATGADNIHLPQGIISVRCQWVPLADGGRYLDMRLCYDSKFLFGENFVMADVDSIGFLPEQLKVVKRLRAAPGGIRAISGPTNQGKTTTLRMMLNRRMAETNMQLNCLLIEDPPEGGVIGSRQIGVSASVKDEQREKSFQEIIRCALRLDPDIVMLGEIRDAQTANFAFRLALTGRQVYTTTHVYSALAVPTRLRDIGIEPFLVYDAHLLTGMSSQRLLRALCSNCRIPLSKALQGERGPLHQEILRRVRAGMAMMDTRRSLKGDIDKPFMERLVDVDLSAVCVANEAGCPKCYKGRSGRTVAAEIIETDPQLMTLLQNHDNLGAESYWLSPKGLNGISMLWHGLEKVRRGEVSPVDAEFELGVFARDDEIMAVEKVLGPVAGG